MTEEKTVADRAPVSYQGMTEENALAVVLGEERMTGERLADLLTAVGVIQQSDRAYQVILHALHSELGSWQAVATEVEQPLSTVHNWAHRAL
jgi:hypothetical protein